MFFLEGRHQRMQPICSALHPSACAALCLHTPLPTSLSLPGFSGNHDFILVLLMADGTFPWDALSYSDVLIRSWHSCLWWEGIRSSSEARLPSLCPSWGTRMVRWGECSVQDNVMWFIKQPSFSPLLFLLCFSFIWHTKHSFLFFLSSCALPHLPSTPSSSILLTAS